MGGRTLIFGGGEQVSVGTVQAIVAHGSTAVAGQLPGARSDLTAVSLDGTAYLLGGYNGAAYDPSVLATRNGHRFATAARLPVPVRYPAVVAAGSAIWIFGGQTSHGITNDIQRVTLPSGRAAVVGHLPQPVTAGAAFALGGTVYLAGGQTAPATPGRTTASPSAALATSGTVLAYHPGQSGVTTAGYLPVPVSNAGVAVLGGTAYLIGGEDLGRPVPAVTRIQLVPGSPAGDAAGSAAAGSAAGGSVAGGSVAAGAAGGSTASAAAGALSTASEPWLAPAQGSGHLMPGSDPAVLPGDVLIADDWNNRLLIVDPQGRIRWQFPQPGDLAPGQAFRLPDDAFFSPDGRDIIATEEDYSVISVIDLATHRIVYRYGTRACPGQARTRCPTRTTRCSRRMAPWLPPTSRTAGSCWSSRPPTSRPGSSGRRAAVAATTARRTCSVARTARSR